MMKILSTSWYPGSVPNRRKFYMIVNSALHIKVVAVVHIIYYMEYYAIYNRTCWRRKGERTVIYSIAILHYFTNPITSNSRKCFLNAQYLFREYHFTSEHLLSSILVTFNIQRSLFDIWYARLWGELNGALL